MTAERDVYDRIGHLEAGIGLSHGDAPPSHRHHSAVEMALDALQGRIDGLAQDTGRDVRLRDDEIAKPSALSYTEAESAVDRRAEGVPVSALAEAIETIDALRRETLERRGGVSDEMISQYYRSKLKIDWSELSVDDANQLIYAMALFDRDHESVVGIEKHELSLSLGVLKYLVPKKDLERLYNAGTEKNPSSLRRLLGAGSLTPRRAYHTAEVLHKVYHREGLDTIEAGRDRAVDRLKAYAGQVDAGDFEVGLCMMLRPEEAKDLSREARRLHNERVADYIIGELGALGLSEKVQFDFYAAACHRLMMQSRRDTPRFFNEQLIESRLSIIRRNVETVGVEAIERLHDKLGAVNFDNYDAEDLASLDLLLEGSPDHIAQLKGGDVTVIFTDAYGDYNGAFELLLPMYRKEKGRTLLFEVGSSGDFYRRMILLRHRGIRPSTLVVGAHGSPGNTHFGAGFALVADTAAAQSLVGVEHIMIGETRLDRLASEEFMQPSRGIDDPQVMIGRRRIIINSCSSDKEFAQGVPSTARVVARRVGRPDTDIYGAREDMYADYVDGKVRFNEWRDETDGQGKPVSVASKLVVKRGLFSQDTIKRTFIDDIPIHGSRRKERG